LRDQQIEFLRLLLLIEGTGNEKAMNDPEVFARHLAAMFECVRKIVEDAVSG